jgi:hypothetical protein
MKDKPQVLRCRWLHVASDAAVVTEDNKSREQAGVEGCKAITPHNDADECLVRPLHFGILYLPSDVVDARVQVSE